MLGRFLRVTSLPRAQFAVSCVILCEKLRISLRVDSYGGVWVARLDGSNGGSSDNQHATTKSVYRN